MALANNALITRAEALQELNVQPEATVNGEAIDRVIEGCTAQIEAHLSRQIRNRAVEFVDLIDIRPELGRTELLYVIDRPVFTITSVKEADVQAAGDFWATVTALTEGVDYTVNRARGRFERLQGGWSASLRQAEAEWYPSGMVSGLGGMGGPRWGRWVQIKYYAGFEGLDAMPAAAEPLPDIFKVVCRQLVALSWKEITRGMQGTSGVTDETGNFARFSAAKLTLDMKELLDDERRSDVTSNASRATHY